MFHAFGDVRTPADLDLPRPWSSPGQTGSRVPA